MTSTERALHVVEIGLDDGYAWTKVALPSGQVLAVASRACVGTAGITGAFDGASMVHEYETAGRRYSVGPVDAESTRFDDYPYSNLNRVIVQHALQAAELDGSVVNVVSGLPVSTFFLPDGSRRDEQIARKVGNLLQEVVPCDGRLAATIARHSVIPEALAAWYDFVIIEGGTGPEVAEERVRHPVAVIDIGGRTTDFVVVQDRAILHRSSGSLRCGMLDLTERVRGALSARFALEVISDRIVDDALKSGAVRLFGIQHDVSALVATARDELVETLRDEARRHLGRGAELEQVLFVGGGAVALAEQTSQWFPNQHVAPMPAFANARGMLKFQRYVGL